MIGKMNVELIGVGRYEGFKQSGVERGKLKLPGGVEPSGGALIAVGENEDYLHCFTATGEYFGVYKSEDPNHIYQRILELNNLK